MTEKANVRWERKDVKCENAMRNGRCELETKICERSDGRLEMRDERCDMGVWR